MVPRVLILLLAAARPAYAGDAPSAKAQGRPTPLVITLGDSITRGVRPGVITGQTFAALLEASLRKSGLDVEVVNVGIGGETTEGALRRLAKDVLARRPAVVTVMYGTNDSYVDRGKTESRLTAEQYRANVTRLVRALRDAGAVPILMTEPRLGDKAAANGAGEHPNVRLERYMDECRAVARETKAPLVDHFAHWTAAARRGTDVGRWTTDQCHPNPEGHQVLAETILPELRRALGVSEKQGGKP